MTETTSPTPGASYTAATLTPMQVNILSVPLTLLLLLACLVPYLLIWGPASLMAGFGGLGGWLILVIIGGVVVHELLHGLGWMGAGGVALADIKFGMQWKALMPYAHARVPMPVRAYRVGTALPGLVTGMLPVLLALVVGQPVLLLVGAFFVIAAVGDLMILWVIRGLPPEAKVLDHPTLPGCLVLNEA